MFHLTTEISNIDFSNDVRIFNDDRLLITSDDIQIDIGNEENHGYHILFRHNGDVISDFHGVQAEDFMLDVKNHTLIASFLIDPMAPVMALAESHPKFSVEMHTVEDCEPECYDNHREVYHGGYTSEDCYPYCDDNGEINYDIYPALSLDEVYEEDIELIADQDQDVNIISSIESPQSEVSDSIEESQGDEEDKLDL